MSNFQWVWVKDALPKREQLVLCGPAGGIFTGVPNAEIITNLETGEVRGQAWSEARQLRPFVAWMKITPPNEFLRDAEVTQ